MNLVKTFALAVATVLLLTGCARMNPEESPAPAESPSAASPNTEKTINDRKAQTQAIERQIVESIPGHEDIRQSSNGALFTCAGGDRQWVGGADVVVQGKVDMDSIVEALLKQWSDHGGYAASRGSDSAGVPTVEIVGDEGEGYLVAQGSKEAGVALTSSSRCFSVPNGFSGAGSW